MYCTERRKPLLSLLPGHLQLLARDKEAFLEQWAAPYGLASLHRAHQICPAEVIGGAGREQSCHPSER